MAHALDVANYIARWFEESSEDNDLTPMKLHKLLYYSQGFHLALCDSALFTDPIEAWENGPVVRSVYTAYASQFSDGVYQVGEHPSGNADALLADQQQVVDEVLETYGQFSAWRLREMTHEERPWADHYQADKKNVIPIDEMADFFRDRVAEE